MTGYQSKKAMAQAKLDSMEREALKLALEALLNSVDLVVEDAYNAEQLYGNYPTRQGKVGGLKVLANKHREAIVAAKEALAQPEQEPVAWMKASDTEWSMSFFEEDGYVPLYTAPPQEKQND